MKKYKHPFSDSKSVKFTKNIISGLFIIYTSLALVLIGNTALSSIKNRGDLINNTFGFPKSFTLDHYKVLFVEEHFAKYFFNSSILVIMGLSMLVFFASMVAYGLSRFEFKGKRGCRAYFLMGLMFPIQLGILPIFVILTKLHLNNTLFGVALLYASGMSFAVFVFSNFFKGVPWELSESAKIDGATEFQIFAKIIIPISKPVLFTIGIINFVGIWNDFFIPLVFLTKSNVRTLTLAIYTYMSDFLATWHLVFAAVVVVLIPIIIVFVLFSENIAEGLANGAVKG